MICPWMNAVPELSRWAHNLVVRRDAHGRYIPPGSRTDPKRVAFAEKSEPTEAVLRGHFLGEGVIGLYVVGVDGTSRFAVVDFDRHGEQGDSDVNERAAIAAHDQAIGMGLSAFLEASNGRGGYKLWLIFREPVPARWVRRLAKKLVCNWKALGLEREPEVFPKQDQIEPGKFGNFVRLPGRHHTLPHWSKVWDGSGWLDGEEAARAILATVGSTADVIPVEFRTEGNGPPTPSAPRGPRAASPSDQTIRLLRSALGSLPAGYPACYDGWLELGMSLFDLGDAGLELWEFASKRCPKYRPGSCSEKWRTFRPGGGRTYKTIFFRAKQNGWKSSACDSSAGSPKPTDTAPIKPIKTTIGDRDDSAEKRGPQASDSAGQQPPAGIATPPPPPPLQPGPPSQPAGQGGNLPEIVWNDQPMHPVTEQALAAIKAFNRKPRHFRLGSTLVRVREGDGSSSIEPHSEDSIRGLLDRSALWVWEGGSKGDRKSRKVTPPPKHIVRDMRSLPGWPSAAFPPLDVIVRCPTFAADGSLIDQPGYHAGSRSYYSPPADLDVPSVPIFIDDATLKEAKRLLDELVCDFPFKTPGDKANAFAVILTTLARHLITGPTPFMLIDAPVMGTGKSKLAEALLVPALGQPSTTAQPGDDDEWRKAITASLIESPQAIWYDNLAGSLKSQKLEQVLTSEVWTDRLLGETRTVSLPNRCVWLGTANNLQILGDLLRRIVWIRLVSQMERPEDRDPSLFKHRLPEWALANRGDLIWAGLVLVRAWVQRGRPEGPQSMASFDSWARTIGGILQVAGIPGFLEAQKERRIQSDDLAGQYAAFFESVYEKLGTEDFGVKDLKWVVDPNDATYDPEMLQGVLTKETKGERAKQLGWRLSQNVERVYGGFQLLQEGRDSRSKCPLYKVKKLDEVHLPAPILPSSCGDQTKITPIVMSREDAQRSKAYWSRLEASGFRLMDLVGIDDHFYDSCHILLLACDGYRLITDRAIFRLIDSHGRFSTAFAADDWSGRQSKLYEGISFINTVLERELEFSYFDRVDFEGRTLHRYLIRHSWDLADEGGQGSPPVEEWLQGYDRDAYQDKYSHQSYYQTFTDLCRRWWLFGTETMSTLGVLMLVQEFNLLPDFAGVYPELPQERELAKILASIAGFEFDGFVIEDSEKITNIARPLPGEPDYFWKIKLVKGFNPPPVLADQDDPAVRRLWEKEFPITDFYVDWLLTPRN